MPGMTGTQLAAEMRARHGDVPVRLVTALRGAEIAAAARAAGVEVMAKPIESRALQAFVAGLSHHG